MRKGILEKIVAVILALCILFPATMCFADTTPSFSLSVTSTDQKYKVGDEITLTVGGHDIKDMYAFEAVLVFNPDVLQFESSKVKLSGNGLPVSKVIDKKVVFAFTRIGAAAGENGDRTLCEYNFKVLAEGKTVVKLDLVKIVKTDKSSQTYAGNTLSLQTGNRQRKRQS